MWPSDMLPTKFCQPVWKAKRKNISTCCWIRSFALLSISHPILHVHHRLSKKLVSNNQFLLQHYQFQFSMKIINDANEKAGSYFLISQYWQDKLKLYRCMYAKVWILSIGIYKEPKRSYLLIGVANGHEQIIHRKFCYYNIQCWKEALAFSGDGSVPNKANHSISEARLISPKI